MKKIIVLVLLISSIMLCLAACDTSDGDDKTGDLPSGPVDIPPVDNTGTDEDDSVIFSPSVSVSLIKATDAKNLEALVRFAEKITNLTGRLVTVNTDRSSPEKREIVFGNTLRQVSIEAKSKMDTEYGLQISTLVSQGKNPNDYVAFAIYASNGAVSVVWQDGAIDFALTHFESNFLSSPTLYMKDGFFDFQMVSLRDFQIKEEYEKEQATRNYIKENYGAEVLLAIDEHLALFDESFYIWLADLYDPGKYDISGNPKGGGFYYSNSARDTIGFGVDIETTRQVLSFLSSSGMLAGRSLKEVIPEKMQKEIVAFVLSCQSSEDGYFYHPQWGTEIGTSRRSRDLSNATSLLSTFGYKPYWDTPNGVEGTLGQPGASATSLSVPLSARSSAVMVSKIVPVAEVKKWTGSEWLSNMGKWEAYLQSYESTISTKSYSIGNNFSSQASQIVARDSLAIKNGELPDNDKNGKADGGYIELWGEYFGNWQNKENGLWQDGSVEDGTVYYAAINGLMKISSCYNSLGLKFPNADKAFECAAFMVTYFGERDDWADVKGEKPSNSVDVYNPWVALSSLSSNIRKYGSASESDALKAKLRENSLELIKATTKKTAKFKKADGSYGYNWVGTQTTSQGCKVALPGDEGDVNGGCIAFTGIYSNMASVLGFADLKPFGRTDLDVFIERATSRDTIDKTPMIHNFDGLQLGEVLPSEITATQGKVSIVEDSAKEGNVIQMNDNSASSGVAMKVVRDTKSAGDSMVLEFDIKFDEIITPASVAFQIKLGTAYMLILGVNSKGELSLADSSSTSAKDRINTNFTGKFDAKVWNSIRVVYRVFNEQKRETQTDIYVNGTKIATSTNFYDKHGSTVLPSKNYGYANFYSLNGHVAKVSFDNIHVYYSN